MISITFSEIVAINRGDRQIRHWKEAKTQDFMRIMSTPSTTTVLAGEVVMNAIRCIRMVTGWK